MWLGKEYISCYNTNGNKAAVNIYILENLEKYTTI